MNIVANIQAAINRRLMKGLYDEVNKIAVKARANADSWSHGSEGKPKISDGILVGSIQERSEGGMFMDIILDLNKAPQAAAFEWGSGIHDPNNPHKYKIEPKNATMLAFLWPNHTPPYGSPKFIGVSKKTGKFLWNYVDHPGVEAKPFLTPAIVESKESLKNKLAQAFVQGFMDTTPRVTVIEVKL
jgi:hypothetical protein